MNLQKIALYIYIGNIASVGAGLYTVPVTFILAPEDITMRLVNFGIALAVMLTMNPVWTELWNKWNNK